MLEAGLLAEAEYVWHNREVFRTAAQAIGYKEFFPYFQQTATLEACTEKLKQASRNYAKRQLTWFRHMDLLPSREEIAELYAKDDSIAFVDSILTGYEKKKVLMERFMEKGILAQTGHKRNIEPER